MDSQGKDRGRGLGSGLAARGSSMEAGEPGVEVTASEGDVVIFPSGNVSDTRAGEEGATILVLEIVTAEVVPTPPE